MRKKPTTDQRFYHICKLALYGLAGLMLSGLTYFSVKFCQVEHFGPPIMWKCDFLFLKAISLFAVLALTIVFYIIFERSKHSLLISNILRSVIGALFLAELIWFVRSSDPLLLLEDSGISYSAAVGMQNGSYDVIKPLGYVYRYPNMLGVISLNRILFFIFGNGDERSFYYLNIICVMVIYWAGASYIRLVTQGTGFSGKKPAKDIHPKTKESFTYTVEIMWELMLATCLPYTLLVLFRYGDLLCCMSIILTMYLYLRYEYTGRIINVVILVLDLAVVSVVRQNLYICVLALFLVILFKRFSEKKYLRGLMESAILILCVFALQGLHSRYYESKAGNKIVGAPSISWIAMGMQDDYYGPGYWNGYNWTVYDGEGGVEEAVRDSKEYIRGRIREFAGSPAMAYDFYKRKTLFQWIDPEFDAMRHISIGENASPLVRKYLVETDTTENGIFRYLDIMQSIIYLSAAIFVFSLQAAGIKKEKTGERKTDMSLLLPIVFFIGGFLFTVLWEAKSRYVIGYYEVVIMMAAAGLAIIAEKIINCISGQKKRKKD